MTLNDVGLAIAEIKYSKSEVANFNDHTPQTISKELKDLYYLFGQLFSFPFGTADQDDLSEIIADVKRLYENQIDQTNIVV